MISKNYSIFIGDKVVLSLTCQDTLDKEPERKKYLGIEVEIDSIRRSAHPAGSTYSVENLTSFTIKGTDFEWWPNDIQKLISLHYPGPWVRQEGTLKVVDRHGFTVHEIPSGDTKEFQDRVKANGALIAAAPELLEACKEFVRKVEAGEARSTKSYNQMKEAIKKAEEQTI